MQQKASQFVAEEIVGWPCALRKPTRLLIFCRAEKGNRPAGISPDAASRHRLKQAGSEKPGWFGG